MKRPQSFDHETIEQKARHFTTWHPTTTSRLEQLQAMTDWASHFNPQWKVNNMVTNATILFAALTRCQAHYLVIGGFAAIIYGVPRFTHDVDLFIEGAADNIRRVIDALSDLGSEQAKPFQQLILSTGVYLRLGHTCEVKKRHLAGGRAGVRAIRVEKMFATVFYIIISGGRP